MISGTSTIWSKSGPVALLIITKMLQTIQEKLWNHPGTILFMSIWDSTKIEHFRNIYVIGTVFSVFRFLYLYYILYILFYEDEGREMIHFSYLSKKHEM